MPMFTSYTFGLVFNSNTLKAIFLPFLAITYVQIPACSSRSSILNVLWHKQSNLIRSHIILGSAIIAFLEAFAVCSGLTATPLSPI